MAIMVPVLPIPAEQQIELILISSESLMQNLIRRKLKIFNRTLNREVREII